MLKLVLLRILVFLAIVFITPNIIYAQKYNLAAGLRWGGDFGISVSERVAKRWTLEQNINAEDQYNYYSVFALARYHQPLVTNRFNWFYGGGPGIVRVKETDKFDEATSISFLAQTGLEITINRISIYGALEPYFYNSSSGTRFKMHKVVSVKYVILKRKSAWKKKFNKKFKWKKNPKKKKNWWKFWKKESNR